MKTRHQQRGMTAVGWVLVLGLIAFFTLITLRLVPFYLEYSQVSSIVESLHEEPGITKKTKSEIIRMIFKRFSVNNVRDIDKEAITITKADGILTVSISYERRDHLLGNVDVVAKFDKSTEVVAN